MERQSIQPNLRALIERTHDSVGAGATVLFHRSGQIMAKHGSYPESDYPTLAVLVAGMVAAGQSLAQLMGLPEDREYQLSHGAGEDGVYAVRVNSDYWVFAVYKKVLNPGLFRMQLRRLAKEIGSQLDSKQILEDIGVSMTPETRAKTAPKANEGVTSISPKVVESNPKLFTNITDEEIDRLFQL